MKLITQNQENKVSVLYCKGNSGLKIAKKLGLSLNQVYDALKRNAIPRRNSTLRLLYSPLSFRFREHLSFQEKQLLTAAIMLYLGEGAKTETTVDLANSNPGVLKIFITFLRKICQIDETKLRLYLYCFSNQNIDDLKKFWSKELNVSANNFTKPYIRKNDGTKKRIMPWGVVHIRYSDKRLLEKILFLCSDLSKSLLNSSGRYSSGQRGQTVKKAAYKGNFVVNIPG